MTPLRQSARLRAKRGQEAPPVERLKDDDLFPDPPKIVRTPARRKVSRPDAHSPARSSSRSAADEQRGAPSHVSGEEQESMDSESEEQVFSSAGKAEAEPNGRAGVRQQQEEVSSSGSSSAVESAESVSSGDNGAGALMKENERREDVRRRKKRPVIKRSVRERQAAASARPVSNSTAARETAAPLSRKRSRQVDSTAVPPRNVVANQMRARAAASNFSARNTALYGTGAQVDDKDASMEHAEDAFSAESYASEDEDFAGHSASESGEFDNEAGSRDEDDYDFEHEEEEEDEDEDVQELNESSDDDRHTRIADRQPNGLLSSLKRAVAGWFAFVPPPDNAARKRELRRQRRERRHTKSRAARHQKALEIRHTQALSHAGDVVERAVSDFEDGEQWSSGRAQSARPPVVMSDLRPAHVSDGVRVTTASVHAATAGAAISGDTVQAPAAKRRKVELLADFISREVDHLTPSEYHQVSSLLHDRIRSGREAPGDIVRSFLGRSVGVVNGHQPSPKRTREFAADRFEADEVNSAQSVTPAKRFRAEPGLSYLGHAGALVQAATAADDRLTSRPSSTSETARRILEALDSIPSPLGSASAAVAAANSSMRSTAQFGARSLDLSRGRLDGSIPGPGASLWSRRTAAKTPLRQAAQTKASRSMDTSVANRRQARSNVIMLGASSSDSEDGVAVSSDGSSTSSDADFERPSAAATRPSAEPSKPASTKDDRPRSDVRETTLEQPAPVAAPAKVTARSQLPLNSSMLFPSRTDDAAAAPISAVKDSKSAVMSPIVTPSATPKTAALPPSRPPVRTTVNTGLASSSASASAPLETLKPAAKGTVPPGAAEKKTDDADAVPAIKPLASAPGAVTGGFKWPSPSEKKDVAVEHEDLSDTDVNDGKADGKADSTSFAEAPTPALQSKGLPKFSFGTVPKPSDSLVSNSIPRAVPKFTLAAPKQSATSAIAVPKFSFGATPAAAVSSSSGVPPPKPSFSFGVAPSTTASATAATGNLPSFTPGKGASVSASGTAPSSTAASGVGSVPKKPTFQFGAATSVSTPDVESGTSVASTPASSTAVFKFGANAAIATPQTAPSGSSAPAQSTNKPSVPLFQFGASAAAPASAAATSMAASKPSFQFGAASQAPSAAAPSSSGSSASFVFGAGGTTAAPTGSVPARPAMGTTPFQFGASASTAAIQHTTNPLPDAYNANISTDGMDEDGGGPRMDNALGQPANAGGGFQPQAAAGSTTAPRFQFGAGTSATSAAATQFRFGQQAASAAAPSAAAPFQFGNANAVSGAGGAASGFQPSTAAGGFPSSAGVGGMPQFGGMQNQMNRQQAPAQATPLQFGGQQASQFGAQRAQATPLQFGGQQAQANPPQFGGQQAQANPPQFGAQQVPANPPQFGAQQAPANPPQFGGQRAQASLPQFGSTFAGGGGGGNAVAGGQAPGVAAAGGAFSLGQAPGPPGRRKVLAARRGRR